MTVDYTKLEPGKLLNALGDDAEKWADAFLQLTAGQVIDKGIMIAWFASAIVRAVDEARWRTNERTAILAGREAMLKDIP